MGLIGTRSISNEIPGINDLVMLAEVRIRQGIQAYDALEEIRALGGNATVPPSLQARFEANSAVLGYALLLKRYVDDPRQATEAQIKQAALDTVPQVAPLFWSFRIMVGLGMFFIVLTAVFFWLSARRRLDAYPWLLKVAVWSIPLPWIAAEAGWIVAELGRQPWAVEGVLPTAVAVSNLGVQAVLTTLIGFVVLYSVLIVVEMKLMLGAIRKGPQPEHDGAPGGHSPLVGATPGMRHAQLISAE